MCLSYCLFACCLLFVVLSSGFPAVRVVVVGGGAGGVELALAMQYRLKKMHVDAGRDPERVIVAVVNRGDVVLSSHNR